VAILSATAYDDGLVEIVRRGLRLFDLPIAGKRVVLKPNFVEHDPNGVVNTHPALVAAAIEAFRRAGARHVVVAEGPGHYRDTEHLLTATGLHAVLREHRTRYVDLNNDDTRAVRVGSHYTGLRHFHLPETLLDADLLVSMPKLKTHHWAGVTLSLKNMFGCIPGAIYGWPKNVLHWAGIHQSIVDINSTLPVPRFAIVDGIVGMEGNGPIQGDPRPCGALVFGDDPVAVDATAARLMTIDPRQIRYLIEAGRFLGNVAEERIDQAGEPIDRLRQDFRVLPAFHALKSFA
jgi:uncharacterized protein (DUF362 family)